ncbi:unnamed protein product [Agarophyton chilense]|eukprot:gb/GEZJ01003598.1/.p1 GENE.gb/GEZJ01003598.1/~~gb/GEZJ01003598.1/.p1  ORF type:complete len:298 (+),score=35.72 gb/GEZJ01003598.1/:736-1629(+)
MTSHRPRSRPPHSTLQEPGIVKLARCLVAMEDDSSISQGTIFPVSDDIPELFDARNPPHGIQKDSREAKLLKELYDRTTKVKCHIESCKKTFVGFGQILNHKRAERDLTSEPNPKCRAKRNDNDFRKISKKVRRQRSPRIHICLHKHCLASFNKGFNANRHFYTQHNKERRRQHVKDPMVDNSIESRSIASSHDSSDRIEFQNGKEYFLRRRAVLPTCEAAEERGDDVQIREEGSHTTVTHSDGDERSTSDKMRKVSSDVREGALSLMKLRYPDEMLPDVWRSQPNGSRYSRCAGRI